jgi:P pilus assembly chaperone PapD
MRFTAILFAAAALVAAAATSHAELLAQVTPIKYSVSARPGTPVARDVLISNEGSTPVVVRVRLSDWTLSEQGDMDLVPAGSTGTSLEGLVEFEPKQFSLQAGESGHIRVTLSTPADGPATRWGVLLSEVRPTDPASLRFGPRAIAELGTTIYLSRAPAGPTRAEVTAMDVFPLGDDSLAVSVRVRNAGERHFYVGGEIALADSNGARVAGGKLGTGVVLPGSERRITWTCGGTLPPGRLQAIATLDTGEPELTVGEKWFQWPLHPPAALPLAQQLPR